MKTEIIEWENKIVINYLMCDWDQAKESGGLRGSPFAAGAVRQWYHYRLQFVTAYLKMQEEYSMLAL